jgi:hypothetical protein
LTAQDFVIDILVSTRSGLASLVLPCKPAQMCLYTFAVIKKKERTKYSFPTFSYSKPFDKLRVKSGKRQGVSIFLPALNFFRKSIDVKNSSPVIFLHSKEFYTDTVSVFVQK